MKKVVFGVLAAMGALVASFGLFAFTQEPKIRAGVFAGPVELAGLTRTQAEYKLRAWWEEVRKAPLELVADGLTKPIGSLTPGQLGVTIDDVATTLDAPMEGPLGTLVASVQGEAPADHLALKWKSNGADPKALDKLVDDALGDPQPARIGFSHGEIVRVPEVASEKVDRSKLMDAVSEAVMTSSAVKLPFEPADKHVPDAALAEITDVVSEFTTHFRVSQRSRDNNIRVASGMLSGHVLMPGETMSFNSVVGERTRKAGFSLAGIYKDGKHDVGIGGGICQVSTTLYNASLLANLGIDRRVNHSMPVPYVPLGRDATVDYGSADLVIRNSYSTPIAVTSEYQPGALTFRILGKKDPGLSVKIVTAGERSWPAPVKKVPDAKLAAGKTQIVEKGCPGFSIRSYRLVFENGTLVKREALGTSFYPGGKRIVSVGKGAQRPAAVTAGGAPEPVGAAAGH